MHDPQEWEMHLFMEAVWNGDKATLHRLFVKLCSDVVWGKAIQELPDNDRAWVESVLDERI